MPLPVSPLRWLTIVNYPVARLLLLLAVATFSQSTIAATYYIDSKNGDDNRDGLSKSTAWQSLARTEQLRFGAGDRILLRAGSVWSGAFRPRGGGAQGRPVVIDRYGEGARPEIRGEGKVAATVALENSSYIELHDLSITNHSEVGAKELRGVEVRVRDLGVVRHVVLQGLDIHDVNGVSDYKTDGSTHAKSFGGIVTIIEGTERPTAWDGLRIEDCRVYDVGPIGIVMMSSWMAGHRENDPRRWFPSRNVLIRGNRIERTARNGLIVRGCEAPVVEHNVFSGCAHGGSGNSCFAFHCDDALFQFNEACFTRYNQGDTDATGFDSDYNCRRSVFQFNYSHDNEYGFMVVCCLGPKGFNDGTIVRYNISQNDGGNVFRLSGSVTNTKIYGNTIYIDAKMSNPAVGRLPHVVYCKSWNHGWSDGLAFFDNVIYCQSPRAVYATGESTNNVYCHNLFYGLHAATEPRDPLKSLLDPVLHNPGKAKTGLESAIQAYSVAAGAPEFGSARAFALQQKNGLKGGGLEVIPDVPLPAGCGAVSKQQPELKRE